MRNSRYFWLASMLMCAVMWLPLAVSADNNSAGTATATGAFCDQNLTGLVSYMLSHNDTSRFGAETVGNTGCWIFSGSLVQSEAYYSMMTTIPEDAKGAIDACAHINLSCDWTPFGYGIKQFFNHPANQVVNIGLARLSYGPVQLPNTYQICYTGYCFGGSIQGSKEIVVTLPISGSDFISIGGTGLAVQYVTLGTNDATPTVLPITNTPGPTPTATPSGVVGCGLVQDCTFTTLPTNSLTPCASAYWSCIAGPSGRYVAQLSSDHAAIFGIAAKTFQSLANTVDGTGTYSYSFSFRLQPGDTGTVDTRFRLSGYQQDYVQNAGDCAGITGTTYCLISHTVSASLLTVGTLQVSFQADMTGGDIGTLEVISPTVFYNAPVVPTSTPTTAPTDTRTPTPISYDGSVLPTSTPTYPPGTNTPTPNPSTVGPWCNGVWDCNSGNSAPNSTCNPINLSTQPPANILPGPISGIPILSDILKAASNIVVGAWQITVDLVVPQHINCDFGSIQTQVATRVSVPNLATIVQPLSYANVTPGTGTPTGCGYLGVQNLGVPVPNQTAHASPFATVGGINIGVDGCSAPWNTYFPFGKSMINFSMLIWFATSTLKFALTFFTAKSFGSGD